MIRTQRSHLSVAALSHPGMTGKNNEDNFAVSSFVMSEGNQTPALLAVVADGIGGHSAGEVASEIVVNLVSQVIAASNGGQPLAVFQQAFYTASEAVYAQAQLQETRYGMGATCSCAWVIGSQLYVAYAGDSRIYLLRENEIKQISIDHTWVQEAIALGIVDPEMAKTHPNAHVIRRYLGSESPPEPDMRLRLQAGEADAKSLANQGLGLLPGDLVLLCTDGLTDLVEDPEIFACTRGKTLEQAAQEMINLACQRGGHDNITVVLLGVPGARPGKNWLNKWLSGE
jgi:PPM family protein phosphatase